MEGLSTEDLWSGYNGHTEKGEPATAVMEIGLHNGDASRIRWCDG